MAASPVFVKEQQESAWRGFAVGMWQRGVDVRDFIQLNYSPTWETAPSCRGQPRVLAVFGRACSRCSQRNAKTASSMCSGSVKHPGARTRLHR
jgi:pyruvate-formate lyase